jgi:hypothetical protein
MVDSVAATDTTEEVTEAVSGESTDFTEEGLGMASILTTTAIQVTAIQVTATQATAILVTATQATAIQATAILVIALTTTLARLIMGGAPTSAIEAVNGRLSVADIIAVAIDGQGLGTKARCQKGRGGRARVGSRGLTSVTKLPKSNDPFESFTTLDGCSLLNRFPW